jgi:hypothetical protein
MLAHHSTPALGSPLAPFDANGDNAPDTVLVTAPTEPGGAPGVSVRLSGASPSTVALSAAAGSSFGFDIAVVDPDGPGGLAYRVAVSEPRRMVEGAQRGAVWFFDAVTGQSLGSWTSPEPASLRVGLRVQFVADQDLDGQADLLVEGARLHDGVWQPRVLLVSGANQRLLRESTAGFAESLAAVRAGVALFSPADVNGDGTVDGLDLLDIATHVGQTVAPYESGDLNGDGHVNAEDIHLATDQFVRGVRVHSPERLWNDSARVAEFDQVWGQAYLGNPGTPFVAPSAPASPLPASTGAESSTESPQFVQLEGENEEGEPFHPPQLLLSGPPATRSLNPWIGQYSCGEDLSQSCKLGSPDPANAWQAGIGWCLLEMQNCPSGPVGLDVGIPMPKATGTIQNLPGTQCVTEISQDGEHWFDVTGEDEGLAGMPFVPANGGEFLMSTSIEGCVLVRIRCWNDTHDPNSPYRGCCACTQCAICSQGPEAPPCPIRIDILNPVDCTAYRYPDEEVASCQTPPESVCTVYRSSCDTVRLRAMAQPPGGFFSWTVNGYPYEYPGSPAEQAAAAQQNPNQIRLTPERLEETCQIVRVTYSLYEEGTLICEASRTIRIINDDLDCDDLTDDAELNVYGTDKNDSDTDDDGFCDGQEVLAGTNPLDHSSFPSGLASDIDGDGLADSKEEQTFLAAWPFGFPPQLATETVTSPVEFDTDHDGVQDLAELALGLDPVQRFLPPTPGVEANVWSPAGNSGTTRESDRFSAAYMAADRDQDLLFDEYERSVGMDPSDPDMDKDGIRDGLEIRDGTDPRASHRYESADTDGDGLSDYEEANFYGTDPNNADTDKDSLPDGFEIRAGLNPHTARTYSLTASGSGFGGIGQYVPASVLDIYVDLDGDGLNSLHEYAYGTDPLSPDTDNDGVDDKTEIIQTTSPLDPTDADQGLPRDQVCVVRITIGPHTHDVEDDFCHTAHGPDFEHYTYDPIGNPAGGEFVKRDFDWSISIGGGGSTGGPVVTNPARLTTHDGEWAQLDVVLRKGQCLPITIGSARQVPGATAEPNYFLGAFPVDDFGGSQCLTCCCLAFDEPEHYPFQTTFFGSHCDLSTAELEQPKTGYICLSDVDLDIDSDNTNKLSLPQESESEDDVEESIPGKVIAVHDDDSDRDGIPDWADGFKFTTASLGLGTPDNPDQIAEPGDQKFVPVVVKYAIPAQTQDLRVTFDYAASDPALVTTLEVEETIFAGPDISETRTRRDFYLPGDGPGESGGTDQRYRLWIKDGNHRRDARSVDDSGDFVPADTELEVAHLDPGGTGRFVLYLEAVRPTRGDTPDFISVAFKAVGTAANVEVCPDKVAVSATLIQYVEVRPLASGTEYRTVTRPSIGCPAPKVSMEWHTVGEPRFDPTYTRIVADLFVDATVTDFASDLIPTSEGVITSGPLVLNGEYLRESEEDPVQTVNFTVSKTLERTTDPVHPYPFMGSTPNGQVFNDVPVEPGWNQLRLVARNRHGFAGFSESAISYEVDTPDVSITLSLSIGTANAYKAPEGTTGTLSVTVTQHFASGSNTTSTYSTQVTYSESGDSLGWHASGSVPLSDLDFLGVDIDGIGLVRLYPQGRSAPGVTIPVTLSAPETLGDPWVGTGLLTDDDQDNYVFSRVTEGEYGEPRSYDGEDNLGYMIEFVGPSYLKRPEDAIALLGRDYKYTDYDVDGVSRTFLMNPSVAALESNSQRTPAVFVGMPNLQRIARDPFRPVVDYASKMLTLDYMHGYAVGVWEGGVVSIWDGLVGLIDGSSGVADWIVEHGGWGLVIKRFELDDQTFHEVVEDERAYWTAFFLKAGRLAVLDAKLRRYQPLVLYAIATGDTSMLDDDLRNIVETTRTIADTAIGYIDNLPPRDLGELHGNITGQLLQIVAIEAATAGLATPALVSKSTLLARFAAKLNEPIELAPKLQKFRELLSVRRVEFAAELAEAGTKLATTKMCFAAGTLVWTADGLKPIEAICPGDWVLSRNEQTEEQGYKPVVDTIVTHPTELWSLELAQQARTGNATDRITGTGEHPFWVLERNAFVPMREVRVGDTLSLADGGTATVMDIAVERGPPRGGTRATTYNLEIAEYHTYFVGREGVWVHNASELCEKLFSTWKLLQENFPTESVSQRWARLEQETKQWLIRRSGSEREAWKHYGDALDEVVKDMRRAAGKTVPEDWIFSPGAARDSGYSTWKHWTKHGREFPEISGPVEYVDKAMDFASHNTSSGSLKVAEGVFDQRPTRIVWDRAGGLNNYCVATVNPDGSLGPISSFYRLDRNWIETRTPLRDIPNGPDVFEQYFDINVQEMNGVLR